MKLRLPWSRRPVEARTITAPWDQGDPLRFIATQDRALTLVPVYAAVRLLADTISTLPVKAFRRAGDERVPMVSLPQLFAQLDEDGTLTDWLHRCVSSLALQGNAVGLVVSRDGMQFPTQVEWLDFGEVYCDERVPARPIWYWRGRSVPTEDIVHIPWFTVAGKVLGLSPIEAYATTVDVGLQAQVYGSSWFASGGVPPGTFKNKNLEIDQTQADIISARVTRAIRQRKTLVYGADWDYAAQTVAPEQAQFIQTQKLVATQIASIYGIPPEMIGGDTGGNLTYSSPEQNMNQLSVMTLRPWLVKLERKFSAVLPSRQYVRFNADSLVRADLAARMAAYKISDEIGLRTKDEMRALEDLPPLTAAQKAELKPPEPPAVAPPDPTPPPVTRQDVLRVLAEIVDADVVDTRALEGRSVPSYSWPGPTRPTPER